MAPLDSECFVPSHAGARSWNVFRITSNGEYLPELDGIRFLAIFMVLIQHVHERLLRRTADTFGDIHGTLFDQLAMAGRAGVALFFGLSGYILYRGLSQRLVRNGFINLKAYYMRRLTRLEPPYILVMTGIFFFLTISGFQSQFAKSFNEGAQTLYASWLASMVYSYTALFGTPPKLNPPAWSLEIEVQFYLLAPALCVLCHRMGERVRIALAIVLATAWISNISPAVRQHPHLAWSLLAYFPYFLMGIAAYEILRRKRDTRLGRRTMDLLGLVSLIGLPCCNLVRAEELTGVLDCLCVFGILLGVLGGQALKRVFSCQWVALIGGMCYSIYLLHLPVLEVLASHTAKFGLFLPYSCYFLLQGIVLVPCVVALAFLFYLTVERPCMDKMWPQRFYAALRAAFA